MTEDHRWSGWPGAWCLDCGIPDPAETCIATHDIPDGAECPDHPWVPCSERGSDRHNPYAAKNQMTGV